MAIFIDIDADSFARAPARLEEFLVKRCVSTLTGLKTNDGKRICAVIPVHLFGLGAEMLSIIEFAAHWNLPLIEGAVQSIGARCTTRDGVRSAGGVGVAGFF